jgi:magnesium-transporting ATPase (P-type)
MMRPTLAVMMLWVNLIMDTMGALALGTEPPSPELLSHKPYAATASLITPRMWRHVIVQAVFQLAMTLALLIKLEDGMGTLPECYSLYANMISCAGVNVDFLNETGKYSLSKPGPATEDDVPIYRSTFIFNAFVFAQVRYGL